MQLGLSGATNYGLSSVAFAEILIYDRVLSAGELSQVGCYLKNKYAIAAYTGTCN
jgi:hypothetical protein